VGKQRRKEPKGSARSRSLNEVDWELVARRLYQRGLISAHCLDYGAPGAERAAGAHASETSQTVSGIEGEHLMPDQVLEA
jgi:hypothetical protein